MVSLHSLELSSSAEMTGKSKLLASCRSLLLPATLPIILITVVLAIATAATATTSTSPLTKVKAIAKPIRPVTAETVIVGIARVVHAATGSTIHAAVGQGVVSRLLGQGKS